MRGHADSNALMDAGKVVLYKEGLNRRSVEHVKPWAEVLPNVEGYLLEIIPQSLTPDGRAFVDNHSNDVSPRRSRSAFIATPGKGIDVIAAILQPS